MTVRTRKILLAILYLSAGMAVTAYGAAGIKKYGFYFSGRGSIGQVEGGLAPLFLLIGVLSMAYGLIELWLHRR